LTENFPTHAPYLFFGFSSSRDLLLYIICSTDDPACLPVGD
jgi:hypothetical protein